MKRINNWEHKYDNSLILAVIGIKVEFDLTKDVNQRVAKVQVWNDRNSKGARLDEMADDAEYEVITLDFLAYGGDKYDDLRKSPKKYKIRQGK